MKPPWDGPIEVGDHFIWEPDKPAVWCHVVVVRVYCEDDRCVIWARVIHGDLRNPPGSESWNDESRFREACWPCDPHGVVLTQAPGPLGQDWVTRTTQSDADEVSVIGAGLGGCVVCHGMRDNCAACGGATKTFTCPYDEAQCDAPGCRDPKSSRYDPLCENKMASIKNEHIVWAYGDREDGTGKVVVIGLTEQGLAYLRNTPGQTLLVNPPADGFANVTQIVVFHEKSKAALKERFRQAGVLVSEVN